MEKLISKNKEFGLSYKETDEYFQVCISTRSGKEEVLLQTGWKVSSWGVESIQNLKEWLDEVIQHVESK